jgi:hypothetical protein
MAQSLAGKDQATDKKMDRYSPPESIKKTAANDTRMEPAANVAETRKKSEADYGADYQDMVRRVGQMAKQGPRKTVWDPVKRVYKTVPVNPPKDQGVAEGSLEEIDRRGFLKGLGAAAVAGAAGSAKAQNVNYAEVAAAAVQKAQNAIGSFNSVKFGGERNRIMNFIAQNVNRAVLAYSMDTNGYMVNDVIDYATNFAYRQADAVPISITDRAMSATAINVANTFMNSYDAAILQKFNEYKQASSRAQQTQQSTQQTSTINLSQEENSILTKALYVYYFTKNSPEDEGMFKWASKEINNFITARDAKFIVNDTYRKIFEFLEKTKESDSKKYAGFNQWVKNNGQQAIDDLKNLSQQKQKKDEFKENAEQGVAEGKK